MYYYRQIRTSPFSKEELKDLTKAWLIISVAFAIVISNSFLSLRFFFSFILSGLTVGIGFIAHELAHKFVAQHYGCFAEFRAFNTMLMLALIMSFLGFVFAAPGAVIISGPIGRRRNGKISAAGPIANLILAGLFFILTYFSKGIIKLISNYGFMINAWLALFNLIPIGNFDGKKVLDWNRNIYILLFGIAFLLMIINSISGL